MKAFKEFLKAFRTPLSVFFGLFLFDQVAQCRLDELTFASALWMLLQAVCWTLAASSVGLVLGRFARFVYVPVALLLLVAGLSERYCMSVFRMNVLGDWVLLLNAISSEEIITFLYDNRLSILAVLLAGLALSCGLLRLLARWKPAPVGFVRHRVLVALVLWVPVVIADGVYRSPKRLGREVVSFQLVKDTALMLSVYSDLTDVSRQPQLASHPAVVPSAERPSLLVLAIGESATRNNWHLYGYGRDTTPRMDGLADELVVFRDLVGVWSQTPMAVRYLFTMATLDEPDQALFTLPQALAKEGVSSYLVSRQAQWGAWDSMITCVFDACAEKTFLSLVRPDETLYDRDVLPYVDEILSSKPDPKAVFLHLYGSHWQYDGRCPEDEKTFGEAGKRTTLDDYDNTIRHEDRVLGELIARVRALHCPSVVIYVSDHGETPRADSWRVHDDYDLWELPMFIWASPEYRARNPKLMEALEASARLPLQADQLMPLFLSLAGAGDRAPPEKNPLDDRFRPRRPRLIMNGSVPYGPDLPPAARAIDGRTPCAL